MSETTYTASVQVAESPSSLSRAELLRAYRTMRLIREFEDGIHAEYPRGEIPGFVHLSAGQEAIAAGVAAHLRGGDAISATHRAHGHALAAGCDLSALLLEVYGKRGGVCGGKGGSMHLIDLEHGFLGANGIVGAGAPLACGAALAAKRRGAGAVVISYAGDGGSNQGSFLESLNLASVWRLPLVFVVENNGYADSTAARFHQLGIDVARRAPGFSMPGVIVDGHDFFAVWAGARDAVQRARDGAGPTLLECKVTRYYGHGEGHDDQTYRGRDEVAAIRMTRDCIDRFRAAVVESGRLQEAVLVGIDGESRRFLEDAFETARRAPAPDPATLLTDVYASY
jgi:TPP-dependent pyruvate/acetoin dehydrogenase alpha subunit